MHRSTLLMNIFMVLLTISIFTVSGDSFTIDNDRIEDKAINLDDTTFSSNNMAAKDMKLAADDTYSIDYDNNVTLLRDKASYVPSETVSFSLLGEYSILNGTIETWHLTDPSGEVIFNTTTLGDWPKDINSTGEIDQAYVMWEGQNLTMNWDFKNATSQVYVNVSFELPRYPVVLGQWLFDIKINNTNYDGLNYEMTSQVLDTIEYTKLDTYALRGGNETHPIYEQESYLSDLSLGDNITIISEFAYGNTSQLINTSLTPISGILQLKQDSEIIYENIGVLRYFNSSKADVAQGNITGGTLNTTALNFAIPVDTALYGNYTVALKLEFEHNLASHADWNFNTSIDVLDATIKYRIYIDEFETLNDDSTYSLTESAVGFVSFQATHWNTSLLTEYADNNITINITISFIDLNITTYAIERDNSTEIPYMFQLEFVTESRAQWKAIFYQEYAVGDYALSFHWNTALAANDDAGYLRSYADLPLETEFTWDFTLTVSYGVRSSRSEDIYVEEDAITTIVSFRIVITGTNKTVYAEKDIQVTQGDQELQYNFNAATGEYNVVVQAVEGSGTLSVEFIGSNVPNLSPNTINYNIIFLESFETETPARPVQDMKLGLEDYLVIIGLLALSVLSFVAVYILRKF